MRPKIISLGYSVPDQAVTQEEIFATLKYPKPFWKLYRDSGIEKRHFWVPLSRIRRLSFQEQQEEYFKGAVELSKRAVLSCLDGKSPANVGCLVYCSCTGFAPGPTVGHFLSKELGLFSDTFHTNIASQGCESGFPGLKRAFDFTSTTKKPSLVVCCELASCSYFPEPDGKPDPENHYELLRGATVFADAAAAALVGWDSDPRHPEIVDFETHVEPEYLPYLGYVWREGRLRLLLAPEVPELAPKVVTPALERLLHRNNLAVEDIDWWVIHAAGAPVLENIQRAIGLPEEKMALSWETLRRFGNCSSVTVGLSAKLLMEEHEPKPGDTVVSAGVGPGMTGSVCLLRFPKG